MSPDDPRHGTNAGYQAHASAGETACAPCKDARAVYQRHRDYDSQLGRPRLVSSLGTQRRIQALQRLGWSLSVIAREGGWTSPECLQYAMREQGCNRRTAQRIAAVYDRLSMSLPPISSGSARARNRAERLGYPPPLAWDDASLDDPNAEPYRPAKQPTSGRPEVLTATLDDFDWLVSAGESPEKAAERVGVALATIRDYRTRQVRQAAS